MRIFIHLLLIVVTICSILVAVGNGINSAVSKVIAQDSVDKAFHWGAYMATSLPDISELAETGTPTEEQLEVIRKVRNLGDIFRFKLFTSDGRLSLVSDDLNTRSVQGPADDVDVEPAYVAATGRAIVDLYDGRNKPDRPDHYAEAYIPLLDESGQVTAIVEVYVDQTATDAYFRDSFRTFGQMLMVFCALIFVAPVLAYFVQRKLAQKSRSEAEFLARFDPLTGLMNRREFTEQAERAISNGRLTVACYLDLDHFKSINDIHGHTVGDAFLAHFATLLRAKCRPGDMIARFGGDEFVIGFVNISTEDAIYRVKAILQACAVRIDIHNTTLTGSVSVGLTEIADKETMEGVLKNADVALYHAKSMGRDTFAIYGEEMGIELAKRQALEARLFEANRSKDFEVHFQPLVSSQSQAVTGYEALLRLADKDGNPIPPSVFVPMAEDLGLIEEIGTWTIQTAINTASEWEDDATLAINLSTSQFTSGALVDTVRAALENATFPAERLELEITESLLLEDGLGIEMQIDALRDMGVTIAMDDFGTGYSSLSYLWKYGFDRLKIDKSFVAGLGEDCDRSREIIESVVMLGNRLNMKITAEGVETAEQAQKLSDLGCDTLQGYHFGRPHPSQSKNRTKRSA